MRSGSQLTQLVEFATGFPDADIAWELLDGRGTTVATGTITPEAGSASAVVTVSGSDNTLEAGVLASPRELHWSYTVGGLLYGDRLRYRLEAFLPLGVSEEGVRRKLGVERHELEDDKIDLISAYGRFREQVGAEELGFVAAGGGYPELVACDAIEAVAALALLPALQISLAALESSGTNQFKRATIDWDGVRAQLDRLISDGYRVVNPAVDPTIGYGSLLIAIVRPDPLIGNDT